VGLIHGGQLSTIAEQYNIPEQQWLDLSTGIAPFSYPVCNIPQNICQDLPTIRPSLIKAAQYYYQTEHCWPLAGSQQLIEKLPQLWLTKQQNLSSHNIVAAQAAKKRVYLPQAGYKEHQHAWLKAGYQLHFYQQFLPTEIEKGAVVVVINPNNPRADTFSVEQLSVLQQACKIKQALLVIDEAFADIFPSGFSFVEKLDPLSFDLQTENVIILRSIGKFFGLAGLRIGFVCTSKSWCEIIKNAIGPWSINGVALYITEQALQNIEWQKNQIRRLQRQSEKQVVLLKRHLPSHKIVSNALFITVFIENAAKVYQTLCEQSLYVRLTDENDALRFGIADEGQLIKLQKILIQFENIYININSTK